MAKSKGILLALGAVAVAGAAYLTISDRGGPNEGVQGSMGAAERHQSEKTQFYQNLVTRDDTQKIEAIGQIAAKLESAPAEAEQLLSQHGWSKSEFDEMLRAVRSDSELNKMFEAAKARAR